MPSGSRVQINAMDYTSSAEDDDISVILPNKKIVNVKKKDVKLFEAGVYNSQEDIANNPKTGENRSDKIAAVLDAVIDGVENALASLQSVKETIHNSASISEETLEKCIAELTSYKQSLVKEKENSNQTAVVD
jgi:hypothetical protein